MLHRKRRFVTKAVPLWSVTIWDKRFTGVDKSWQQKTNKYKYLLSSELDSINVGGNVHLLYTGKDCGSTTEELAGNAICSGEIVSIPWGGTPSVKYYKGKFVTGDNRIATSSIPDELLTKYLYYYMCGRIVEIGSYYHGAGLKHPSMKSVLAMTISYPSVAQQQKIISRFETIDNLLLQSKRLIGKYDDLVKSRFNEMFGDNQFPTIPLGDGVLEMHMGPFGSAMKNECFCNRNEASCVVYEQKHAIHRSFDEYRYIGERKHKELKRFEVGPGDFLVSCRGTIGKVSRIPEGCPHGVIHPSLMMIRINENVFDPGYFLRMFSDLIEAGESQAKGNCVKMAVKASELEKVSVALPPIDLQKDYSSFVAQVDKLRFVCVIRCLRKEGYRS